MTSKTRLSKLEKLAKPEKINTWQPPIIEIDRGQEGNPDHLQRLAEIRDQAQAGGWISGPYVVEVVKYADDQ
jgi:hypothetical protein